MTKQYGTNDILETFAANGTKVAPDSGKLDTGWQSGERPPYQHFNYLQNLVFKQINYLMRSGIPTWNAATEYLEGDVVMRLGIMYVAAADNNNSQPPSANWALAGSKNKLDATAAPTVNDDSSDGYSVGSKWFDINNNEAYLCFDATVGAAVWQKATLTVDELGALAFLSEVAFANIATAAIASQAEAEAGTAVDKLMTPQRVAQAIAALADTYTQPLTAGAVGTYAYASVYYGGSATTVSNGATRAGSTLRASDGGGLGNTTTLSGTWRCMGEITATGADVTYATVWLRIA